LSHMRRQVVSIRGSHVMRQSASKKAISIIIPTYNRCELLVATLESIFSQWKDEYEVIVVDDGSTDDTFVMLKKLIKDNLITYIYQENSGRPSIARNRGIASSQGEYLCFLDSDDILVEGSIEKRAAVLRQYADITLVSTDWIDLSREGGQMSQAPSWVVRQGFLSTIPHEFIAETCGSLTIFKSSVVNILFTREFVFTSSVMVRRSVLERVGAFNEQFTISEDRDLWLRICSRFPSAYLYEPLALKRRHDANITNRSVSYNYGQDKLAVEMFVRSTKLLDGEHRHIARRELAEFYRRIGRHFWHDDDIPRARYCLGRAARYNPLELGWYPHLFYTFLPAAFTRAARAVKGCFRPVYGS